MPESLKLFYANDNDTVFTWISAESEAHAALILMQNRGGTPAEVDYIESPPVIEELTADDDRAMAPFHDGAGMGGRTIWGQFLDGGHRNRPGVVACSEW